MQSTNRNKQYNRFKAILKGECSEFENEYCMDVFNNTIHCKDLVVDNGSE